MAHLVPLITIRRWIRVVKHAEFVHKEVFCCFEMLLERMSARQNNGIMLLRLAGDVNLRRGTIAPWDLHDTVMLHQKESALLCVRLNQIGKMGSKGLRRDILRALLQDGCFCLNNGLSDYGNCDENMQINIDGYIAWVAIVMIHKFK